MAELSRECASRCIEFAAPSLTGTSTGFSKDFQIEHFQEMHMLLIGISKMGDSSPGTKYMVLLFIVCGKGHHHLEVTIDFTIQW